MKPWTAPLFRLNSLSDSNIRFRQPNRKLERKIYREDYRNCWAKPLLILWKIMGTFKRNENLFLMGQTDWYLGNFCTQATVQLMVTNTEHRHSSPVQHSPLASIPRSISHIKISVAFNISKHCANTMTCLLAMTQSRITTPCHLPLSQLLPLDLPSRVGAGV